jgi:hypothetical protein
MMILVVLRFGTAMAVIDEYLIFWRLQPRLAHLHVDDFHVRSGVQARALAAGLRGGNRHDWRCGDDARHDFAATNPSAEGMILR